MDRLFISIIVNVTFLIYQLDHRTSHSKSALKVPLRRKTKTRWSAGSLIATVCLPPILLNLRTDHRLNRCYNLIRLYWSILISVIAEILTNIFSNDLFASQQLRNIGINRFLKGDHSIWNKKKLRLAHLKPTLFGINPQ